MVTNDDIAPVLTVIKNVVNNDGGTLGSGDFNITVTGPAATPASFAGSAAGTTVTLDAGAYSVAEDPEFGYLGSFDAGCAGDLDIGQTATCVVTNDDVAPVLTVIKSVVNNDGGTLGSGDFNIIVTGPAATPASFAGSAAGTTVTLDAGAYSVAEDPEFGYLGSFDAGCAGDLDIGQTATCVITNDDIAPVLTVIKSVVNNDGGTLGSGDFNITVTGPAATPASFAGSAAGTTVTLDAGAYSVAENPEFGYLGSFDVGCAGDLDIGQTATCVVTNDDIAPVLTVIKNVVNNDGGTLGSGDFNITVTGPAATPASFAGSAAGTTVTLDAGAYSVAEDPEFGYLGSFDAGCAGDLDIGQTATCVITNDDIAPVLTVIKNVVNNDGGTLGSGDFNITVTGPAATPASFAGSAAGTTVTLDAGAYSVAEDPEFGYLGSFDAGCAGDLDIGETATCVITNDDIAPVLTVIKNVVNNDGGTLGSGDFNITVTGPAATPASFAGSAAGTTVTLDAGAYSVAEDPEFGYLGSFDAGCAGDLDIGETATCVITNDDVAPVLTVIKNVVNNDGGTLGSADFNIIVTGPAATPASFAGSAAGTTVTLDAGAYSVAEDPEFGYLGSFDAGCAGDLDIGETATCVITNDDIAPVLTVIKNVVNNDGGTLGSGDFNITVTGPAATPASFAGSAAGTTVTLDAGAYSVAEDPEFGYLGSFDAGCAGDLDIGETATCVITNTDIAPVLTVIKNVINNDGGTLGSADFNITVTGPAATPASFAGSAAGTTVTLDAGAYTVAEDPEFGYLGSFDAGCAGDLDIGETATCVITNTDIAPVLTVIKNVINNDGGTLGSADFNITVTGPAATPASFAGSATGTTVTLDAGAYTVAEDPEFGYLGSFDAGCARDLDIGETATCVITNDDQPASLTVIKNVVGGSLTPGDFTITVTGDDVSDPSFPGVSGTGTTVTLNAGAYSVSEVPVADYSGTFSTGCSGELTPGQAATCTVTNTLRPGTIIVEKQTNPDGSTQSFNFTASYDADGFSLVDGGENNSGALLTGTYSVAEIVPNGWTLAAPVTCSDGSPANAIVLDPNETVRCIFNNTQLSTIIIKEQTIPAGLPDEFGFIADPPLDPAPFTLKDGESHSYLNLAAGDYKVTQEELFFAAQTIVQPGIFLASIDCDDTNSTTSVPDRAANIVLEAGETVTCTFVNVLPQEGTIIVRKEVDGYDTDRQFPFDASYEPDGFSLEAGQENVSEQLPAGTYSVEELVPDGWDLDDVVCSDGSEPDAIELAADETVVCTFTNVRKPGYDDDTTDDFDSPFDDAGDPGTPPPSADTAGDTDQTGQQPAPAPAPAPQPAVVPETATRPNPAGPVALEQLPRTGQGLDRATVMGGLLLILGGFSVMFSRHRKALKA